MKLRAGTRLRSAVCSTEVIVVRPPSRDGEVRCGGVPMIGPGDEPPHGAAITDDARGGTQLGKRYDLEDLGIVLLCTKPGEGTLAYDDAVLHMQDPNPLPATD